MGHWSLVISYWWLIIGCYYFPDNCPQPIAFRVNSQVTTARSQLSTANSFRSQLSTVNCQLSTGYFLVFSHRLNKSIEQIVGIVGAWAGFGVVLDREQRQGFVFQSSYGTIVQIEVSNFYFGS